VSQPAWGAGPSPEPDRRRTPVADIFEETFRLYRQNFPLMVGVTAVFQIPIVLLSVPFQIWQLEWSRNRYGAGFPFGPGELTPPPPSLQELRELALIAVAGWAFVLVVFVLGTFGAAAMSYIVGRARNGDPPPAREVFLALRRLAGPILGYVALLVVGGFLLLVGTVITLALVATIVFLGIGREGGSGALLFILIVGIVAIVVLWIALGIRLSLALPALVLERQRPMDALRRSWNLVRGSTWRTFGILFLASLVVGVIGGLVSVIFLPGVMEGLLTGSLVSVLLVTLGSGVVQVLLGPILPILLAVVYFDYVGRATA
jgi:hypothetical protein